jgi:CPA1 family monovalent cation:H+ antiporter
MRGAVSLAAALAVPLSVDARPAIVFTAFAVILITLVGQGLTLPLIVRTLHVERSRRWSDEEAVARMEAAQSALDRLDQLEDEGVHEEQLGRLRELYRRRFRVCQAVLGGEEHEQAERESKLVSYGNLRRELIGVERDTLLDLRADGRLADRTLRLIERDLDLEEARLRV